MDKGFKPAQRKILVSTTDEPEAPPVAAPADSAPQKVPPIKTVAAAASKPADPPAPVPPPAEPTPEPETETKPPTTVADDKTSFPPTATAETPPAIDVEALRRQYHIPVGKVARKFSPRRHWWLGVVLVLVLAVVGLLLLEPQL